MARPNARLWALQLLYRTLAKLPACCCCRRPYRTAALPGRQARRAVRAVASPVAPSPVVPAAPLPNQHLLTSGQEATWAFGKPMCGKPEPMGTTIDPETVRHQLSGLQCCQQPLVRQPCAVSRCSCHGQRMQSLMRAGAVRSRTPATRCTWQQLRCPSCQSGRQCCSAAAAAAAPLPRRGRPPPPAPPCLRRAPPTLLCLRPTRGA